MLVALFAVIFWTIMFFIACAVSPTCILLHDYLDYISIFQIIMLR